MMQGCRYKGPAQRGAYRKGYEAARRGEPQSSNPYYPPKCQGGLSDKAESWAAGFCNAWDNGWHAGRNTPQEATE